MGIDPRNQLNYHGFIKKNKIKLPWLCNTEIGLNYETHWRGISIIIYNEHEKLYKMKCKSINAKYKYNTDILINKPEKKRIKQEWYIYIYIIYIC